MPVKLSVNLFLYISPGEALGYIMILFITYGWAVIPMMYIFSYLFQVASTAFVRMTILNILTGLATLLVVYILSIPSIGLVDVAHALKWAFLIFPNYNLGKYTLFYKNQLILAQPRLHLLFRISYDCLKRP